MKTTEEKFDYETIPLKDDYEGKNIATLIKSKENTNNRTAVLYIHGFVDYFFHPHLTEEFHKHNYDFYALDLRKYGRSLLKHQHACYAKSLDEYFEEISYAINQIYETTGKKKVLLIGHSTGGLTISVYANRGAEKEKVAGLILNSPFLDMNISKLELGGLKFTTEKLHKILLPYLVAQKSLPKAYVKSIHKDYGGEWDFNQEFKPLKGFPTYFLWLKTIMENQKYIKNQSNLNIPVLLLHSSKSVPTKTKGEATKTADMVLNVEHMKQIGPKIGSDVTLLEVKDGMHDIFLSKKESREFAFEKMFEWLDKSFN